MKLYQFEHENSHDKIRTTRYRGEDGRIVPKGTPGARKVVEESDKWYAEWYVGRRKCRQPLSTDKTVSQKLLGDLIVALEKGKAGLGWAGLRVSRTPGTADW